MAKRPLFNEDGLYERTFTRIFDLVLLSIYTLVACIPIITIGSSFASLLYCNKQLIINRSIPVTKTFWGQFVGNFKKSIPLWMIALDVTLILAGVIVIVFFGNRIFGEDFRVSQLTITIVALVVFFLETWLAQILPMLAYFENSTKGYLKTAFQIPFATPFWAILVMVIEIAPIVICILNPLVFFLEGVIGIAFFGQCITKCYMKIIKKLGLEKIEEVEETPEEEKIFSDQPLDEK